MTELVARLPRPRGSHLRLFVLVGMAAAAGLAVAGALVLRGGHARTAVVHHRHPATAPRAAASSVAQAVPARLAPLVSTRLGDDAARGLDRGFFTSSPGGVLATTARVAAWRSTILWATRWSGIGPNMLEALVLVESSGRADALSSGGAAGLTQLGAAQGRRLGLHVNLARSRALTRRIDRADARGAHRTALQLRRWRARYDERFDAAKELRATVAYLAHARRVLGRDDLAFAAYHVGIRNLERAAAAYGGEEPSYAQLYFGSAPDLHRTTWRRLESGGGVYWKMLAAKRLMLLARTDPTALVFEQAQQSRKNSAEEVLHPRYRTYRFASPAAIARAWRRRALRAIPLDVRRTHVALAASFGAEAHKLGRSRRLYRGLRPATLDVLLYIGKRVHRLSHARRPLILTSALRDSRYQRVLMRVNANAARTYSIHTTGYAFDVARSYASARQAAAFEFVLDRLEAVNAIAYIREAAAIHVAVASDAPQKLALLARAG